MDVNGAIESWALHCIGRGTSFPFAASLCIFLPRTGTAVGSIGALLMLVWPALGLLFGHGGWSELLRYTALPLVVLIFSAFSFYRLSHDPQSGSGFSSITNIALCVLPWIIFFGLFNGLAIVALLFEGPPPWPSNTP